MRGKQSKRPQDLQTHQQQLLKFLRSLLEKYTREMSPNAMKLLADNMQNKILPLN